jgi:hypothetical protein
MVTHDAVAASYAEMADPTADRILDAMKGIGE